LQRIAQTVDAVLADEIIRTPSGRAYIPEQFVVFLNPTDERAWQGGKREFIRHELAEIILTEARRRAGEHELTTDKIVIEFRVDATLEDDELRVSAVYHDRHELTIFANDEKTFVSGFASARAANSSEKTEINLSAEPLYSVEVWENGKHAATVPVYKSVATIGRGTNSFPVDVPLRSHAVSRRHAVSEVDENKDFWLLHGGANPTVLGGRELPPNVKTPLLDQQKINIGEFELQIKV